MAGGAWECLGSNGTLGAAEMTCSPSIVLWVFPGLSVGGGGQEAVLFAKSGKHVKLSSPTHPHLHLVPNSSHSGSARGCGAIP